MPHTANWCRIPYHRTATTTRDTQPTEAPKGEVSRPRLAPVSQCLLQDLTTSPAPPGTPQVRKGQPWGSTIMAALWGSTNYEVTWNLLFPD